MYAKRHANAAPRSNNRRQGYVRPLVRARVGLLMRKGSNFGELADAEQVVRGAGLGLAPLSNNNEPLSDGGMTIMATAKMADLDSGALRGLVIPDGTDADSHVTDAAKRAMSAGLPVMAFGDSVALVASAAGVTATAGHAALISTGKFQVLDDMKAVIAAAEAIN